ncbi:hypothetical protein BHM03_00021286 [Ensete ventricosum]|uniref:Uncharacterized protein n=1 Tax=Ensete ventricosum TaxID=4639 RepID=A0A445MG72_ENSVE|nr:hypothetical protein BHM03_00021286 [Ensete ventricosum]
MPDVINSCQAVTQELLWSTEFCCDDYSSERTERRWQAMLRPIVLPTPSILRLTSSVVAPPPLRRFCHLNRGLRSQICWKERSPASSLDTDLLEGAVSCFLPQHRSAITLRPGQIA